MSHLYEGKIKNMGNAGRNGGEYYTPRPLIKTIVKVVSPKIGNKIYDGAVGSAGFLCEAFNYLKKSKKLGTKDMSVLQKSTFYGKEKKSLAYIIGTMNMILHGIEAPNIVHTTSVTYRKKTVMTSFLPILLLAARNVKRYSRISRLKPEKPLSSFCSILSRF
jgi:type I restriction enzyme M protein